MISTWSFPGLVFLLLILIYRLPSAGILEEVFHPKRRADFISSPIIYYLQLMLFQTCKLLI